jgi:hypothetical protein
MQLRTSGNFPLTWNNIISSIFSKFITATRPYSEPDSFSPHLHTVFSNDPFQYYPPNYVHEMNHASGKYLEKKVPRYDWGNLDWTCAVIRGFAQWHHVWLDTKTHPLNSQPGKLLVHLTLHDFLLSASKYRDNKVHNNRFLTHSPTLRSLSFLHLIRRYIRSVLGAAPLNNLQANETTFIVLMARLDRNQIWSIHRGYGRHQRQILMFLL